MPASLLHQRIADQYTSLLHVSGASIDSHIIITEDGERIQGVPKVYDGAGNVTGISLSSAGDRVVINNFIQPEGWSYQTEWLDAFFPINSVILTTNFKNPGQRIVGTKWILESQGIFPVGVGTGTDKNNNSFTFTAGNTERQGSNLVNGDIAGEFRGTMDVVDVPPHSHTTNTRTQIVPEHREGEGTNVGFIFYFGDTINPAGLVHHDVSGFLATDVVSEEDHPPEDLQYLDADAVEAFEYNTTYNGIENYRDFLIRADHGNGKVYTNADFNPLFANQTLEGWAPPAAGGAGWGGILNTTGKFLGNSPRPIGIPWTSEGTEYVISKAVSDPRSSAGDLERVHPGRFSDRDLIKARDFIIDTLGLTEAAKALAGVNRLIELGETVAQASTNSDNTYYGMIPMNKIIQSTTTGQSVRHNNIPPTFPVYLWRRVALTYVDNIIPPNQRPSIYQPQAFSIESNKKSTKNNVFNLNKWAIDNGWDGEAACAITINEGVYIYSDDPNDDKVPGMVIDEFPGGLALINNGFIMGRGGNGGFAKGPGQDGGDAINITGNTGSITIQNDNGSIGGGGGGGGGCAGAAGSGGGGGAGGGWGGTSSAYWPNLGGAGGQPGQPGRHGKAYVGVVSYGSLREFFNMGDIITDGWGPVYDMFPGVGGQAGGSGAGRHPAARAKGSSGTGGGGGRILSRNARGGGGGGRPGTRFSGLEADGSMKPRYSGPGPVLTTNGSYSSSNPTRGWVSGYPARYSSRRRGNFYHPWRNFGYHYRANGRRGQQGIPYIVVNVKGVNSYMSPTGWNGDFHWTSYVHGGYANKPGANFGASGDWAAGGGGWGAAGGSVPNAGAGGKGGKAVRFTGSASYTINGGLVYGTQD